MAKRRNRFDEAKIKKIRSEGRGSGTGRHFNPWIRAHESSPSGLTTRVLGWKSGRDHHFFSTLEKQFFYLLEWSSRVLDIRERFPLDHYAALHFAKEAGIDYPWDRKTGYNVVMTTDFLITVVDPSGDQKHVARSLEYAKGLRGGGSKTILEKLEIQRRFWSDKGIDWGIVTDLEIPKTLVSNIEDCHDYRDMDPAVNVDTQMVEDLIQRQSKEHPEKKLSALSALLDRSYSFEPGTTLAVIRYLLANKRLTLPGDIRWLKVARCKDIVQDRGRLAEAV